MDLVVSEEGDIRCIYDEVIDLAAFGRPCISRGSFVEPSTDGYWHVDLSPVHGPTLGPFEQRSAALAAEHSWLESHWLTEPCRRRSVTAVSE